MTIYELNTLELIQLKQNVLDQKTSHYFKLLAAERELKNIETELYLKTDFKAQGLTNEKQRTAFVNDHTNKKRFEIDDLKYTMRHQDNLLTIIDDLIHYKGGE